MTVPVRVAPQCFRATRATANRRVIFWTSSPSRSVKVTRVSSVIRAPRGAVISDRPYCRFCVTSSRGAIASLPIYTV